MGILRLFPWDRLSPPPPGPQELVTERNKRIHLNPSQASTPWRLSLPQTLSPSDVIRGKALILGSLSALGPKPLKAMEVSVLMPWPQYPRGTEEERPGGETISSTGYAEHQLSALPRDL